MNDLTATIEPRSDQLNADHLVSGSRTIKVTRVSVTTGDQPVTINYEGDNGKPYKPGKSMRRVLFQLWGKDGNEYIGRRMTLYRDDKVSFGGVEVGGIRISHMSHINGTRTLALTASKAKRAPFTVQPLADEAPMLDVEMLIEDAAVAAGTGTADYQAFWSSLSNAQRKAIGGSHERLKALAEKADSEADMQNANEPSGDMEEL